MNKQDAQKEIDEIKARLEKLQEIVNAPDFPEVFHGRYLAPSDNKCLVVYSDGVAAHGHETDAERTAFGTAFATKEAAEQHAKHLLLMQEARVAMAKDWQGFEVKWPDNGSQPKWCIDFYKGKAGIDKYRDTYHPIHFRTESACREFLARYSQEDLKLMIMGVQD